jgi:hypothetical protein
VTLADCGEDWARCSTTATEPCFGDTGGPGIVQLGPDTVSKDPSPANGTWRLVAIPLGGAFDCSEIFWLDLTQPDVRGFIEGSSNPEGPTGGGTPPATTPPPTTTPRPQPPQTKLLKVRIDADNGTASFRFKGSGEVSGFRCALAGPGKKAKFRTCRSPKSYKNLAPGTYTFKVRAVGPGAADATPAKKKFTIH